MVKRPIWAGKSEIFKFPLRFKTDKLASSLMALGMAAIMLLDKSNILKTGNKTLPVPDEEVWIFRWSRKLSLRIKVRRLSSLELRNSIFILNPYMSSGKKMNYYLELGKLFWSLIFFFYPETQYRQRDYIVYDISRFRYWVF